MIVTYENDGRYSAATAAGVAFFNVSRVEAERALVSMGIDPDVLDEPVDGLTWRSTLTSAFAHEIEALTEAVENLPEYGDDVAEIRDKQAQLEAGMIELNRQLRVEGIRTEIARTEAEMDRQVPIMRRLMGPKASDNEVWAMVKFGPIGRRLEALLAELRQSA